MSSTDLLNAPLSSVDDAAKFFELVDSLRAHKQALPPINHVFFAKIDEGLDFQPYHIRAVSKENRPTNYYIVTRDYVIKVNRELSTFETVGTVSSWRREAECFSILRKMQFFKNYLRAKMLTLWKMRCAEVKYNKNRTILAKQLLVASPLFSSTVMSLKKTAFDLEWRKKGNSRRDHDMVCSIAIYSESKYPKGTTLDEFSSTQFAYSNELKRYLAKALVSILTDVLQCSDRVDASIAGLPPLEQKQGAIVGAVNKELANEKQLKLRQEYKKLVVAQENISQLVHAAHILQVEALFRQACASFFELGKVVNYKTVDNSSVWFFRISCVIDNDVLTLSPNKSQLLAKVEATLNNSLTDIANIPSCAYSQEAKKRCSFQVKTDHPSSTFFGDPLLMDYQHTILDKVEDCFEDAQSKLSRYDTFLGASNFLNEFDRVYASWKSALETSESLIGVISESELRSCFAQAAQFLETVKKLEGHTYGIIYVSCQAIVESLTVRLNSSISSIQDVLRTLTKAQSAVFRQQVDSWKAALQTPPLELTPYVSWLEEVLKGEEAYNVFSAQVGDLQALQALQSDIHERIDPDAPPLAAIDTSVALRDPLLQVLTSAKQFHAAHRSAMSSQLTAERQSILTALHQVSERVRDSLGSLEANEGASALKKLERVQDSLRSLRADAKRLDHCAEGLEMAPPKWLEFGVTEDEVRRYEELWKTYDETERLKEQLRSAELEKIDGQTLRDTIVTLFQRAFRVSKAIPGDAAETLMGFLSEQKAKAPLYVELCNPALKEKDWDLIFEQTGVTPIPAQLRTLGALEVSGLLSGSEGIITEVVSNAVGVFEVEQSMSKLHHFWQERRLPVVPYAGRVNAFVMDGADELLEELEEQQVVVQTCLASKHVTSMRAEVEGWDEKLATIRTVILEWVSVQKAWMYLEFIFSSDDIKRQLPDESLLFSSADRFFTSLMKKCYAEPLVAPVCLAEDMLKKLHKCTYQLESVQKKLDEYLETKRVAFPRFYFLSNDELLSILSDSRNPQSVQPHLQKCFDNIKELIFADAKTITAMRSSEGEQIVFSSPIKIIGNVENWLNDVERGMRETLHQAMRTCLAAYTQQGRVSWYFAHAAQCVATVDQMAWTQEVEAIIASAASDATAWSTYTASFQAQLLETVALVKRELTPLERQVVSNLIVADVHCRDINARLAALHCASVLDFEWLQQLRYYWAEVTPQAPAHAKDCVICHGAASLRYGYEYLGNQPRLVITPLTERAFLTCTAALHMQKGAAPQGPAGTGKTESVKDLGKALARQVVVFNCSDGLNYKMMSQMFAGLAQGGAWACFDEFNRIELEVLSVIAQQMLDITTAIAQRQTSMSFEGHRIRLHPNFGVFITMNPGYAGRTELPDNLKALFRPICMMIPNYALIAEIMFYSEGYTKAGVLADKMIRLYSLASQQLSQQDHYDFGMRAVKAILVVAGRLKRANPDTDEERLLLRSICDANLPKFLTDDAHLFLALVRDFFPDVAESEEAEAAASGNSMTLHSASSRAGGDVASVPLTISGTLQAEATAVLEQAGLQATQGTRLKLVQLFDTLITRHGLMLVGHTMTGKTTLRNTLAAVLTGLQPRKDSYAFDARSLSFFTKTSALVCNPKSITMTELYGDVNPLTREWQDGVFSAMVRDLVKTASAEGHVGRHWVVFDGPVDAIWVENLNTVLDDNKMLCLVNGERIRIPEPISILFEVQDLRVASPATVSRCGMVYVDREALDDGWRPIVLTLSQRAERELGESRWKHKRFMELCDKLVPPLLHHMRTCAKEYIPSVDAQLVRGVFEMLRASLQDIEATMEAERSQTASQRRTSRRHSSLPVRTTALLLGDQLFDALFIQSCTWGLGGNLADGYRDGFAAELLRLVRHHRLYFPDDAEGLQQTVYDYGVDAAYGDWQRWVDLVPPFQYNATQSFFDMVVPTAHTVVLHFLLRCATLAERHVLLNGLTGTAKSSTVNHYVLSTLRTEHAESEYAAFSFALSAQSSSRGLQETIEGKMTKRRGDKELGPPPNKKLMIAVIDDCNVPQLEVYGTAPPIELLRQMITQGGFFDRKKLFFKEVVRTMLIACCGEPGGGKNPMTPRFTSQLLCFCVPQLSPDAMRTIYETILRNFFDTRSFADEVLQLAGATVDSTLEAYSRISRECLPTPEKTHCTFNLRDVSKVIQGVLQVSPAHCRTADQLAYLWSHEASRVFHDRLVDDQDRGWWWRCCRETIEKHFATVASAGDGTGAGSLVVEEAVLKDVLYGNWGNPRDRTYQRIEQNAKTEEVVRQYLADYNLQSTVPMNLVFFTDAIQHLSRVCRIINQPRGHALLVGVGGSGRTSLCRLAASMMNMDLQTVQIMRGYTIESFRDEMRKALLDSGARGKEVVFMISDPQLVCSEMLEDVNNVLNIGEVPGMMGLEEMEVIMRYCRDGCVEAGKPDTRTSVYQHFVGRCREQLHLVLCMSPMSGSFRERLRTFPALVSCTTIDWFSPWPAEALLTVAHHRLAAARASDNTPLQATEDYTRPLSELLAFMHRSVQTASATLYLRLRRRNHTTPTSYLAALQLFDAMQKDRLQFLHDNIRRYTDGLQKLEDANRTIAELKMKISEMQPVLGAALTEAEVQRQTVLAEKREADVLRAACAKEEALAQELTDGAEAIRLVCEEGLAEAMPALVAAERALQTLSAKDIQEIKTFPTPPSNVEKTMNAVLILLREKDGWASAKVCLGKMDFLSRLTSYPRDEISAAVIKKLAVFVQDPEFVPEVIEKTSLPCRSMCMWVHAMYKYYFVAKEVAPRRAQLAEAEQKLGEARALLAEKQAALQQVLDRIAVLEAAAKEAKDTADHLTRQIETAQARLERADQLTRGLSAERVRWQQNLATLQEQLGRVAGTCALGAGCVAYLGAFPFAYREELIATWRERCAELQLPFDPDFALETMRPEAEVQRWTLHSLPRDTFSVQSATILHLSSRWCYMIDPQGQANQFIRRSKGGANLLVLRQTDDNFMRSIENAVQVGQPVLLEGVGETLDAALDPILLQQVRRTGGRNVVVLGDKEVTYNDSFRLYMTTKLSNPVLTPELQVKVTVLNCTVTPKGLEDQLLADIVGAERAELQASSDRCVVSIAAQREEIRALEEKVLRMLSDAQGDVLDNISLIEALQTSKATSDTIARELAVVEQTSAKITVTRDRYRPLAERGSLIYRVMADLAKVDSMYDYSLQFFKNLVVSVLIETQVTVATGAEGSQRSGGGGRGGSVSASSSVRSKAHEEVLEEEDSVAQEGAVRARVDMLMEEVTWTSYRVVCRGLLERHTILLSLLLTTSLMKREGGITEEEWELFLRGAAGRSVSDGFEAARQPAYMSSVSWAELGALCTLDVFAAVRRQFLSDEGTWRHWLVDVHGDAVRTEVPSALRELSLWHQVLLFKAIRPELVHSTVVALVRDRLGERYTKAPGFVLAEVFRDSTKLTPIIFILSPGTDPTQLFTSFAEELGFAERRYMLSLGQDQGARAQKMIEDGRREGCWVYLQNCHVYASWMPQLQQLVEAMRPADTHDDFRLWLTSSPSPAFPAAVLQAGLKLTREPPQGLRGKVLDTLRIASVQEAWTAASPESAVPSPNSSRHDAVVAADNAGSEAAAVGSSATAMSTAAVFASSRWRCLVFSLALFTGVLMERRQYAPLGWNLGYEWGADDFAAGLKTLTTALSRCASDEPIPWPELSFMLGTIDFGGRVTDMWDTRCLEALTKHFFTSEADEARLSGQQVRGTVGYVPALPDSCTYEQLLDFVGAAIPDEQPAPPTAFGLHTNANIALLRRRSADLVGALVRINAGGGSAEEAGGSGEDLVARVAQGLLDRVPALLPHVEVVRSADAGAPLQTLLSHEVDLYNGLLEEVARSLRELLRALKGEAVMTQQTEATATRLRYGQVPEVWHQVGYLSLKPLASHFEDIVRRVDFIGAWCRDGPPASFWVAGFFFPQGFMTAILQSRSRALHVPIDTMEYRFRVLSAEESAVAIRERDEALVGAYVSGIYLEGCGWDATRGGLVESKPGELTVALPVVHFEPVSIADTAKASEGAATKLYGCPMYRVSTRAGVLSTTGVSTNYVITLQLPLLDRLTADHWVLRGVAALAALDE